MRYLVTGGAGFIGAYTVYELLKRGHEPFVYDSHPEVNTLSLLIDNRKLSEAQIVSGSISDFHRLIAAVKDNRIEKIIHVASPLDPVTEPFPSVAVKDICLAMVNVLEAARQSHTQNSSLGITTNSSGWIRWAYATCLSMEREGSGETVCSEVTSLIHRFAGARLHHLAATKYIRGSMWRTPQNPVNLKEGL